MVRYQLSASKTNFDINAAYYKILSGETINQNQVLSIFPMDTTFYFADVQPFQMATLAKFGREEWMSNVMANELHRHLGVYAVIGVKMGVRAKEYFGAGIDEMSVVSYAGLTPPFSCLNDGIQVSTGATLGHGLIRVASDTLLLPQADFTYMNRRIRLSLKPEFRIKVESEIRELSKIYGLDSNIYWELVRRAAIRYWTILDRQDIFTIQVL
jgi:pyrimidine-specific ribonucleoside hydrolase